MLAVNLQTVSMTEAFQKTFDGKHPCSLCKAIAKGKSAESKKEFTTPLQKFDFPPVNDVFALVGPLNFQLIPTAGALADLLTQQPPTPPPRSSCA